MDSPSSTVRRRAWINSSRRRSTLEEPDPERRLGSLPSASITDDDVFSDGCFTGKIEDWLQACGSNNPRQLSLETMVKANNFDDDLSLGADASVLNGGIPPCEAGPAQHPSSILRRGRLTSSRAGLSPPSFHLGNSMTSSCPSSSYTCKTTSSVSEVLDMYSEDAEETLYELGFGNDEPQATVRIPPRFFTFPSQAEGISFRLFLDAQLRRIREEDPSLSLASRFRQVQTLTAMANVFYSLYSHVSRTPVQKLVPPELCLSSPMEKIDRFRSSVRSEPRSPVERLKDTVSKMCLYTGSPRGSVSTSPQPSPMKRSSLPEVVDMVLVKVKTGATKKLDLGECNRSGSSVDVGLIDEDTSCSSGQMDTDIVGNTIHHKETSNRQVDNSDADETVVQPADDDRKTLNIETSLSTLSGETDHQGLSPRAEQAAMVTRDLICPQIVESVHHAPFCCQHTPCPKTHTGTEGTDKAHEPDRQAPVSAPGVDSSSTGDVTSSGGVGPEGASSSLPVLAPPAGSHTDYCITVTGWEGDGPSSSSSSSSAPHSCHASNVPPVRTRAGSLEGEKTRYLNPPTHQGLRNFSKTDVKPVNSFELEEVHSAGEEEFGQSNTTRASNSPVCTQGQHKGEVVRGDSVQSDSSGYADEEVSPSSDRHAR
ncbi:protein ITPRID2 isoform X1 [Pleuronectes platessa]|uniref:protein ITPRID2 isoform X1 n=1 Tax=Pleuronectes platessa TaxID=8262 RepID=UPI00232A68A3|nr:protein ITPRID2 isoform X1 [Pleuronectes platessa]XP_053287256.1 protein ITPRID2 isoform X1 [Pleuronectes platessa]